MIEDFKKNFKPVFKDVGIETYCYLFEELIVKKNEATGNYLFVKEYPQEIKDFILEELRKVLVDKYLLGSYFPKKEIVVSGDKEIKAIIPNNNHLLNIYLYLRTPEIPGILVRENESYSFRPILEENNWGFSLDKKTLEVYSALKELYPEVFKK